MEICEKVKGICENCPEKSQCYTYIFFVAPQIKYAQCDICEGCHQAHMIPKIGFKCKYLKIKS